MIISDKTVYVHSYMSFIHFWIPRWNYRL